MGFATAVKGLIFRSTENPAVPLSSGADELFDWLGSDRTATGMRIGRESALRYSGLWRPLNLITRDVAKLPINVFKAGKRGKQIDENHPVQYLLRRKPNSDMTPFTFKQTLMLHALLYGNGYAYIYRAGDGKPEEIVPLLPDQTFVTRMGGKLVYHTLVNKQEWSLTPENVFHLKGMSYDGIVGYGVLQKARESVGMGLAMQRYGAKFFMNNAQPSGILKHPGSLSDEAFKRLKDSWTGENGGVENAHKPKILEEGMDWTQVGINAKDAQLIECRQFEIREMANWFNCPPHKLGDNSRLAYNSLEQENQSYLDDALDPWLVAWEQEAEEKLLTEVQKKRNSHEIEFNRRHLIRANMKDRASYYSTALGGSPWQTVNEIREDEGLNPIEEDWADDVPKPLNMSTGQGANGGDTETEGEDKTEQKAPKDEGMDNDRQQKHLQAVRGIVLDTSKRMTKRLCLHAVRASKEPGKFNQFLDSLECEHGQTIREAFEPIAALLDGGPDLAGDLLAQVRQSLLDASGGLTAGQFEAGLTEHCGSLERDQPQRMADLIVTENTIYKRA